MFCQTSVLCACLRVHEMIQSSSTVDHSQSTFKALSRAVSHSASGVGNLPTINLNPGPVAYLVKWVKLIVPVFKSAR